MHVVGNEFFGAQNNAAEAAALTIDMLGCRIDDAVGAELERPLQQRRGEDIVHDQRCAGGMRDFGDRLDVDHLEHRIGRLSRKKVLVLGRTALRHWSRSVPSTRVEATP